MRDLEPFDPFSKSRYLPIDASDKENAFPSFSDIPESGILTLRYALAALVSP